MDKFNLIKVKGGPLSAERRCVSDTWHKSVDEAMSQAEFEFNGLTSIWKVVPEKTNDVFLYGFED
jgi:hypothetical protein